MHLNTSLIYLYDFACRKILHYHREILNQSTRILNHFSPLNGHSNQLAYLIKQKKITHYYRILLSSNLKKQKDNLIETIFKPALVCFIFGWGGLWHHRKLHQAYSAGQSYRNKGHWLITNDTCSQQHQILPKEPNVVSNNRDTQAQLPVLNRAMQMFSHRSAKNKLLLCYLHADNVSYSDE